MASVISKIGNVKLLKRNRLTAPHVPATQWLDLNNLTNMLHHFPNVYVKPNDCAKGRGIIRVDRLGDKQFRVRTWEGVTSLHRSTSSVLAQIRRVQIKRRYIVQQGIPSLTKDGNFFDIRVHLVRIGGRWKMAGAVGKVATKSRIVTNRHSGGNPVSVGEILERGLGYKPVERHNMLEKMENICTGAVRTISRAYPKWREFGVDLGIDSKGDIWIYEVNITPGLMVFKHGDLPAFYHVLKMRKQAV
ncbi:YheC/D like ATP-grasp [Marininema mesophilum]|uniref:YheC/D like ATP-grasp n=1 Tax=Marininema mesophilum TaxID=1048340 RepID=A0A1H3C2E5_9BACL|nr:YheC/YheD family protein [Marininema mesophilum]SDX47804.1 YheC/D like ATP-grasp [Marininema mesophilum]